MKEHVVYHSGDFDGIFCCKIAERFLGTEEVKYTGWDFGDDPITIPSYSYNKLIVMDLPLDKPFGLSGGIFKSGCKTVWIDHHKTSIESHPKDVDGVRIDGVAACRIAWQWFSNLSPSFPDKSDFLNRALKEPLSVRLAGEYDVWDKRDTDAEVFQYGLRSVDELDWERLFEDDSYTKELIGLGMASQTYARHVDKSLVDKRSWLMEWEGMKWLCINHGRFNSLTFASKDIPETGHDALLGFTFAGKSWTVSLYHSKHNTNIDLSLIAKKYGGGGHRGACGFTCSVLPW